MADGLRNVLLDLFFPRRCPFCGCIPEEGQLLCGKCENSLPRWEEPPAAEGLRCAAPLRYEGSVRRAVLRLKFEGRQSGIDCFARLMAECAATWYAGTFDAVTWVPVSAKRLRQRGYDQARLLAEALCRLWDTVPTETLCKTVDNPAQSGLKDPHQRRANVLGVYEITAPAAVAGKRWLLVDDVCTTGATLDECRRMLSEAGAADVVCLTLARTPEKERK